MATIGIDVGSSSSIMATVGRGRIDIIISEISERQTPTLVGFTAEERLIGDGALTIVKTNYPNTCRNVKMLLGGGEECMATEQKFALAPLAIDDDGFLGYKLTNQGKNQVHSAISVMAAYLAYLKASAERSLKCPIVETVIAVPSWYCEINCQALQAAAAAAEVNSLRYFTEHAATALDYGIFRAGQFHATEPQRVLFVNIGHSSSSCFLVDFFANELRVVVVESTLEVSGRLMDHALMTIVGAAVHQQTGVDVFSNKKLLTRIEDQIVKTKKVLSANADASVIVERVIDDDDVQLLIDRQSFLDACSPLVLALQNMLQKVISKNGGHPVYAVELIGGGARVPWVQEVIQAEVLTNIGQLNIGRTLNQEETVARGAALQAAMLSPRFKVKEYKVIDCLTLPIEASWTPMVKPITAASQDGLKDVHMQDGSAAEATHLVFNAADHYPNATFITFPPTPRLDVLLQYAPNDQTAHVRDVAISRTVGKYQIQCNYPSTPLTPKAKLKVKISVNIDKRSKVSAYLSDEEMYEEIVKQPVQKDPQPNPAPVASNPPVDEGADPTTIPTTQYVEVKQMKTRRVRFQAAVTESDLPRWVPHRLIQVFKDAELEMSDTDRQYREKRETLNELESYIYAMRDKFRTSKLNECFTPADKDAFIQSLDEAENWIYVESHQAQKSGISARLESLKAVGDKGLFLLNDAGIRADAYRDLEAESNRVLQSCGDASGHYDHIPAQRMSELANKAHALNAWGNEMKAQESYIIPATFSDEIKKRTQQLTSDAHEVFSTPKPQVTPSSTKVTTKSNEEQVNGAPQNHPHPQE